MSDVYRDTDHRYLTDPAFHAVVKMLERAAIEHGFTPGELKQMAFKAALNIEMRARPIMRIAKSGQDSFFGVEPIPERPPELWPPTYPIQRDPGQGIARVAGHLKDGTPVYFGREP